MPSLKILRYGDSSPQVEMLQLALSRSGFSAGNTDGIFGKRTQNAVIDFQRANRLMPDGIVGNETWNALSPYIKGYVIHRIRRGDTFYSVASRYSSTVRAVMTANPRVDPLNLQIGSDLTVPLNFSVVPTNIRMTSPLMDFIADGITARYPFISRSSIGKSVMGKPLYAFRIGEGKTNVFYNGAHHANEWITAALLLFYLEKYAESFVFGGMIGGENARELFSSATLHMIPLVNPDGVDLVTGNLTVGRYYNDAVRMSRAYPDIPFPSGWKANISGTDLNLQYPAGWENAREIKFSQGFKSPAPRDYVGSSPLSAPESRAVYDYTRRNDFALTMSYHSQGEVIYPRYLDYTPPCSLEIGRILASLSGYTLSDTPYESGYAGYKDWFIYEYFRPGYTVEVGKGVSPLPLSQFDSIYRDNAPMLSAAQILTNTCG